MGCRGGRTDTNGTQSKTKALASSSSASKADMVTAAQKPRPKYAQPLPVRTFPLPVFYPSNPVSLVHLVVAWLSQVLRPPPVEPAIIYEGMWSAVTRSVHITDPQAMNSLWCQGFYGKGSLSRSEPNWLRREEARRASSGVATSEQYTIRRREERADVKWERGRTELEAIEQRRREEEAAKNLAKVDRTDVDVIADESLPPPMLSLPSPPPPPGPTSFRAPVGPLELLALPNSDADLATTTCAEKSLLAKGDLRITGSRHSSGSGSLSSALAHSELQVATANDHADACVNGNLTSPNLKPLERQKSVRFSPTVESTTLVNLDTARKENASIGHPSVASEATSVNPASTATAASEITNKEHLQLSAEEAFFLAYAVGALRVVDPQTHEILSTPRLFELCRQYSYFPPRTSPATALSTDDPFLVHYAVYHHFRSLGWVPRHGIKFGVSWMLYGKGPALDHAEFGVLVVPSYTHPEWASVDSSKTQQAQQAQPKSWHLLHSVNRVLSTVFKSLVLVYVDIPPPSAEAVLGQGSGISALLSQYRIREVMVRRWSSNRNRN
ncbi:tRNA splicing endonuclease subunit sen2 [Sporothrix epigloea]|uniref:tRNA-intron lyase n=1 Tax=Sporothrix epigloea TaxID=1892477 RepID=A0ABP0D8T6_9PEZI